MLFLKFRKCLLIGAALFTLFFSSCDALFPEEIIPAYIRIDSIQLQPNPALGNNEAYLSHNITDAWVYINGKLLGAYEMPFTVPVIAEGENQVIILPGIKLNGISGTRAIYPFWGSYETTLNFKNEEIATIAPTTMYANLSVFPFIEDFEGASVAFSPTINSDTIIVKTQEDVFSEGYSGKIHITKERPRFELHSSTFITLPKYYQPAFIELDYKTQTEITLGLTAYFSDQTTSTTPILAVNPSETWKKIYINLTPTLSHLGSAVKFKLFIGGILPNNLQEAKVFLDNIKIVHFNE